MNIRENIKKNNSGIVEGLFWTFAERITAQLVSMLVTIVIARLLAPEHYGIISIVTVFITFCNIFVTAGFGGALVQKKDADDLDFNTAFLISISLSFVLYALLFFAAPFIAAFYKMALLTPVIRVMGIRLIIASINSIQQAYIQRKMEFKRFFWATFWGTVLSGIVGVLLAYKGFGVWALVAQYMTNVTVDTVMLFIVGEWNPKIQFSYKKAKEIFGFGWKVLATQLVYTLEGDVRSLIVGKVFGSADLAFYDQGKKYPSLLVTNINSSIEKVMLPAYSKKQDEREALLSILRRSIRTGIYLLAPLLLGFAAIADVFVPIVLTDKWLECVPFIQIFCIYFLTRPLESSCHQALLAIGKSGTVLVCMIAIHLTGLITTIVAVFVIKSVLCIAIFSLICTLVSLIVFLSFTNKQLGYKLKMQLYDVIPSITLSLMMAVPVYFIGRCFNVSVISLIAQVLYGMAIYVSLSVVFKPEPYRFIINYVTRLNR